MTIRWTGDDEMIRRMAEYAVAIERTVLRIAQYWSAVLESYAKDTAPWTDRTGNARQSLHTFIEELSRDTVTLYLSHGMEYGIHLETRYAGRYAIIWPTIEAHLSQISRMLQEMFA